MSDHPRKIKSHHSLVLAVKCLPARPPILWTVICWMLTESYFLPGSMPYVVVVIWLLLCWVAYLSYRMIEYPIDIFENFRKPEETEKEDT